MWRLAIAMVLIAAACSSDDVATTVPATSATTVPTSTTATTVPTTTTSSSTTSSTTTTTITPGFSMFAGELFSAEIPDNWTENPEAPASAAQFEEDHTALALPPTSLYILFAEQEAVIDLDAYIQGLQDDLAAFVPEFRVLESGEMDIDGVRSVWFQYAEELDGFPTVIREQAALRDTLLVKFTLISPVEFFEFDEGQLQQVLGSFQFS